MAQNSTENGEPEKLEALVKGRVPLWQAEAVKSLVDERRKTFPRTSQADIRREALSEYFQNHPQPEREEVLA